MSNFCNDLSIFVKSLNLQWGRQIRESPNFHARAHPSKSMAQSEAGYFLFPGIMASMRAINPGLCIEAEVAALGSTAAGLAAWEPSFTPVPAAITPGSAGLEFAAPDMAGAAFRIMASACFSAGTVVPSFFTRIEILRFEGS